MESSDSDDDFILPLDKIKENMKIQETRKKDQGRPAPNNDPQPGPSRPRAPDDNPRPGTSRPRQVDEDSEENDDSNDGGNMDEEKIVRNDEKQKVYFSRIRFRKYNAKFKFSGKVFETTHFYLPQLF